MLQSIMTYCDTILYRLSMYHRHFADSLPKNWGCLRNEPRLNVHMYFQFQDITSDKRLTTAENLIGQLCGSVGCNIANVIIL